MIPELLKYKNRDIYKGINKIIKNKQKLPKTRDYSFGFQCPQGLNNQPVPSCQRGFIPQETISTCSIDSFKDEILNWR